MWWRRCCPGVVPLAVAVLVAGVAGVPGVDVVPVAVVAVCGDRGGGRGGVVPELSRSYPGAAIC